MALCKLYILIDLFSGGHRRSNHRTHRVIVNCEIPTWAHTHIHNGVNRGMDQM